MIKLMIVDEFPVTLIGLQELFSRLPYNLIGIYKDATALMQGLNQTLPDVLLLGIQNPQPEDELLVSTLLNAHPELRIVVFANSGNSKQIENKLARVAKAYLLKTSDEVTLNNTIITVISGNTFIDPVLSEAKNRKTDNLIPGYSLTARETEIVQLLAAGNSNQEIADKLFISYNTIRNHRAHIFMKLEVSTIGELINKAIELGLK